MCAAQAISELQRLEFKEAFQEFDKVKKGENLCPKNFIISARRLIKR